MLSGTQYAAVTHRGGPLLLLAGPGSGKTRVLVHRIADVTVESNRPDRIAALTFTNKAAGELRERLATMVAPTAAQQVRAATFHAFCLSLLREHHDEVGLPRWFSILDAADAERIMRDAVTAAGGQGTDARAIASKLSYAKNTGVDREALAAQSNGELLVATLDDYTTRCRAQGAVDFDDLLCLARTVLTGPSGPTIAARFDSIVVDEWQDTNQVQYDIIAALAGHSRGDRDVCVVGDPMQSIYSWRGSSSEVTERFVAEFTPTIIELGENYRSSQKIVAVADTVAAGAATRRPRLFTENPPGDDVVLMECADPEDEARRVVADIKRHVIGKTTDTGSLRTAAILVRTNAQTRVFETALMAAGVAHQMVGTARFADRAEVKDVLAYLKMVVNPADQLAFARAASTPRRKLGAVSLRTFFDACEAHGVAPGVAVLDPAFRDTCKPALARALASFAEDVAMITEKVHEGDTTGAVRAVLNAGVRAYYASEQERVENLDETVSAALLFEASAGAELAAADRTEMFLQTMALAGSSDTPEVHQVSLITAHASKGREFDYVYVVGAENDIMPHALAKTRAELHEERRLFFVAVSRARAVLRISNRERHMLHGEWRTATRSPFVDEIAHLCQVDATTTRSAPRVPRPQNSWSPRGTAARPKAATVSAAISPLRRVEAPPGPRLSAAEATPGMQVQHATFGDGTIVDVAGSVAAIDFSGKVRSLDLSFAPLTVVT